MAPTGAELLGILLLTEGQTESAFILHTGSHPRAPVNKPLREKQKGQETCAVRQEVPTGTDSLRIYMDTITAKPFLVRG